MFEARSGSAEIDENDVNEALDARTEILRGKRYRLRWDVTSKWKVRREDRCGEGRNHACEAFVAQSSSAWRECFTGGREGDGIIA